MNKVYSDNYKINEIIEKIISQVTLLGDTSKSKELQNMLQAVAEVSFIQGQASMITTNVDEQKSLAQVNAEQRIIDDYASDYKGMAMEYDSLRGMLNRLIADYDKKGEEFPKARY